MIQPNLYAQESKADSLKSLISKSSEDTNKVILLMELAWVVNSIDPEECKTHAKEALKLSEKLGFKRGIGGAYNNIGIAHQNQGNYTKALENYYKSLKCFEELEEQNGNVKLIKAGLGNTCNNIGVVYQINQDYDNAKRSYERALKIYKQINDNGGVAASYNNLGSICYDQKDFDKTLDYFFKSLKIDHESGDEQEIARNYHNIGAIFLEKEELDKALKYQKSALVLQEKMNDNWGLTYSLVAIGVTYKRKKKYKDALYYIKRGVDVAEEINAKYELANAYELLSQLYAEMKDFEKAYESHQIFKLLNDSLFNEQKAISINELNSKYDAQKSQQKITMLEKDQRIQKIETRKRKLFQYSLIGGFVMVLIFVFFIFNQYETKRKANQELEFKNTQLEFVNVDLDSKNRKIAESINYAQRIQSTILATDEQLNAVFEEHFLFYSPRDVVSGDFPWMFKKNGSIYVAAVDCTGHGVPGAMMSMVGYFLLNNIMKNNEITNTSDVLMELHKGVNTTLNQNSSGSHSEDGMDIAFCKFDEKLTKLQFSGAHRPVLICSNSEIKEIRGERFPVGGTQYARRGKEIIFKDHDVKLSKGDSIFLFSDGLLDQIGGEDKQKFKLSLIKDIIIQNHDKPFSETRDLISKKFNNWKKTYKQIDDVLLIGIRV
ncbi:MAG: tetratricopeptide repeat protein [Bacteroidia bacterium]|nr:tetratricopeptide repeat protein [Bacteroidia bacterium]